MVSAHGRLVHVVLSVNSVTSEGISILVANSPNLLSLHISSKAVIYTDCQEDDYNIIQYELRNYLQTKFHNRKLFTVGDFSFCRFDGVVPGTDMYSLWPSHRYM